MIQRIQSVYLLLVTILLVVAICMPVATLFNGCGFGPPLSFTTTSTWTWIDHPVSGLRILTLRPVKTWYPFGSAP